MASIILDFDLFAALLDLSSTFQHIVALNPRKFVMSFTLGSILFMAAFAVLTGPLNCQFTLRDIFRNSMISHQTLNSLRDFRLEAYYLGREIALLLGLFWESGTDAVFLDRGQ